MCGMVVTGECPCDCTSLVVVRAVRFYVSVVVCMIRWVGMIVWFLM